MDGSEAIITSLSVDLSTCLDEKSGKSESGSGSTTSTSSSSASSSSSKRRRSLRTFSAIVAGDLAESAMDAAEKLGIDVAHRLKELGAGPILQAAKEEVDKGRAESERRKFEAMQKDAAETKRKEEERAKKAEEEGGKIAQAAL